ncbi:hypothetical protein CHS0354_039260 [Potamilus streckersoni]|uniref:Uncharacterized protein n=1 Tax=Potamilus streckersoni TaxID=2493646 RepID=A0AAE0S383_9BIVA|nr:hypothetical protein CHS0354_039260 [Potamilus streckersoni]
MLPRRISYLSTSVVILYYCLENECLFSMVYWENHNKKECTQQNSFDRYADRKLSWCIGNVSEPTLTYFYGDTRNNLQQLMMLFNGHVT